jgi:hypothetical protein
VTRHWIRSSRSRATISPSGIVCADPVTATPQCVECLTSWLPADRERWQAFWIDDGLDERLVFYCAECADREFGHR